MMGVREASNRMEESNHKLTETMYSKEIRLLDLSLSESFPDVTEQKEEKD